MLCEALQFRAPARRNGGNRLSSLDGRTQVGTAGQSVELRRPKGEGFRMNGSQRGEQVNRSDGRVVMRPVRGDETDPRHEGIRILSITGRGGSEGGAGKPDSVWSGASQPGEDRGCVEPWGAYLLERHVAPPAYRQVGSLEQAEAGVMVQTFE